jgi:MFS family permease
LAALSGVTLHSLLTSRQVVAWGWRAPLIFGCLIFPFLFLLLRSLAETREFQQRRRHPRASEIVLSTMAQWRLVLMGTMLVTMTTVSFYMITAYTPTFGHSALHLADKYTLIVTLCVGISNFVWLPVMGALSDRVGRLPLLIGFTVLALLTAYPALSWLAAGVAFNRLLAVELWLSFLYGGYNGAALVYLTEIMPVEVRASGFSLAYSLATALFGGFTPMVATYLIEVTRNKAMPGVLLSAAAAIGLAAALWSRRIRVEPLPLESRQRRARGGATI